MIALNLLLQLMIRKMRKIGKVLFIHSHHIIVQISQLSGICTVNNGRSLFRIIKLNRQAIINKTTTVRIDRIGVGVVRIVDIANTVIFTIRSFGDQLIESLGSFNMMSHSRLWDQKGVSMLT